MKKTRSSYNTKGRYYAILNAAEKLFGEKGYQNVSIGEIARSAGVAKGLVNYHFSSKENLLIHVLSKGTATLFDQLDYVTERQETTRDKIQAAIGIYLSIASAGPGLTRMAMIAVFEAAYSESIRKLWLQFMEKNLSKFNELIEEGISRGELKPVDSWLITQLVMAMAFEVLRESTLRKEPLDPREAAEKVTTVLFEGISR
ncbi:MAG: TetR/AcrR family transcriptional regulator [Dehalococcoidia bacterium]